MIARAAKPLLWGAGVVVAGLLLVLVMRGGAPEPDAIQDGAAVEPAVPAPAPAGAPRVAADTGAAPPWSQAGHTAAASAAARPMPQFQGRQPSRAELDQAIVQIREKVAQNDRAADDLLRQLDTMQATGTLPPGINAEALRNNLLVAKRSQSLAGELAGLANAPATEATRKRMDAIVGELQVLQKQLRYDVNSAAAPTPASPFSGNR